ncbi:hypothetical protein [Fictibacillus sp. NRS-1165]|uniref:hypothetical protein n=1 Tax=Fictibacillus sp. NRS-1165 TaxID=3144463 RepID=UPI003D19D501
MYNTRKNNGSLRYFPYGGYDPFHKESVSHHPEMIEHSPPRPPLPSSPPSGNQQAGAANPNPYFAAYPPPPGPFMNHSMFPPRPPYPFNPYLGAKGNGKFNKQKNNQAGNGMFPNLQNGFPFGPGGFPGGQQFPFNQQPFQGNQGSTFNWGKTISGINSAMGMMQQLGSIISIFK